MSNIKIKDKSRDTVYYVQLKIAGVQQKSPPGKIIIYKIKDRKIGIKNNQNVLSALNLIANFRATD